MTIKDFLLGPLSGENPFGFTPPHVAVMNVMLVACGVNVNDMGKLWESTALLVSEAHGDYVRTATMIMEGPTAKGPKLSRDSDGW